MLFFPKSCFPFSLLDECGSHCQSGAKGEFMRSDPKHIKYLKFSSLGLEMGLAVAVGYFIGHWMDEQFDTAPWLLFLWVIAGVGAAFKAVLRSAREMAKEDKKDP